MNQNKEKKSLDFRRDNRSEEQFKKDIKYRTEKEAFLIGLYKEEMEKKDHTIVVENNGVDNTGELVAKSSCAADYRVTIDDEKPILLEVKNSFVQSKWTFKVHQLKSYLKEKASILIFWGTGRLDGQHSNLDKAGTRYGIISPKNIKKMLKSCEAYKEPTFGNKVCVQVQKVDFSKYVDEMCKLQGD